MEPENGETVTLAIELPELMGRKWWPILCESFTEKDQRKLMFNFLTLRWEK